MNEKVIFTNGCFDLIHRGHLELLKYCQKIGTTVIVGMNSDKSARKLKGKNRPINNEQDRKFFLESLRYVDRVFIFDEDTPINLIKTINPDVIVKGGDYKSEKVVGSDLTEVIIFDIIDDYSTTKTIQRITGRR